MSNSEQAMNEVHLAWSKQMAETTLNRMPTEQELKTIGIVPWRTAWQASRLWTLENDPLVLALREAIQYQHEIGDTEDECSPECRVACIYLANFDKAIEQLKQKENV